MRTVGLASNAGVSIETIVRWYDDDWILRRDTGVNENDLETLKRFNMAYNSDNVFIEGVFQYWCYSCFLFHNWRYHQIHRWVP